MCVIIRYEIVEKLMPIYERKISSWTRVAGDDLKLCFYSAFNLLVVRSTILIINITLVVTNLYIAFFPRVVSSFLFFFFVRAPFVCFFCPFKGDPRMLCL